VHFTCAAHSCSDLSWIELFVLSFLCRFSLLVSSRINSSIRFSLCLRRFVLIVFLQQQAPVFLCSIPILCRRPQLLFLPRCSPIVVERPDPFPIFACAAQTRGHHFLGVGSVFGHPSVDSICAVSEAAAWTWFTFRARQIMR
jgi:hypothetical protein